MHQPNLVERVGLLIERGLFARREGARDPRANMLELTFAGRHFMEKLCQAHDAHLAEIRALLGPERYDQLRALTEPVGS